MPATVNDPGFWYDGLESMLLTLSGNLDKSAPGLKAEAITTPKMNLNPGQMRLHDAAQEQPLLMEILNQIRQQGAAVNHSGNVRKLIDGL